MPFSPPEDLPNLRIKPQSLASPAVQVDSLSLSHWESPTEYTGGGGDVYLDCNDGCIGQTYTGQNTLTSTHIVVHFIVCKLYHSEVDAFKIFIYLAALGLGCGTWDFQSSLQHVGSSSLTRN